MKRAWSSRLAWWIACAAICGAVACGDDDGASGGEGSGGENGAGGSAANAGGGLENHELHYDLHAQAHLAEVEHQGLFVDFGTPAQAKYTVGDWNSGWGSRGSEGDLTFANVGRRARLYVHLDEPTNLQVKLHLRPKGTRAVTPYVNNTQHQSIFFEGESWQDVTFSIPATDTRRGENYILLTFGGVTNVGGEEVSVQLASARFVPGDSIPDVEPPSWGTYAANVSLGGASKPAVVYATPHAFTWYAEIPEGGKLAFGAGQEGQAGGTGRVYVTAEGGERQKVWEGALTNAWSGQTVDLSSYAGKIVQIRFEAEGGQGRAAWAEPRIMRRRAEVADVGQARNVVVVLVDTLRASKLKTWNPQSRVRTPAVDALASEGVVFERGNSTENWTKPAVAAVLTGLHPMDHGARTQSAVLSDRALMVSEHFKSNGFKTAMLCANGYVSDRFGFDQGWDRYVNYIRENQNSDSSNVFEQAGAWVTENKDDRFFLYVHTIDPHVPYDPGDEFLSMYDSRSDYEGPVRPRMTGELLVQAKANPPQVTFNASDMRRLEALHDGEISQHDHHFARFIQTLKDQGLYENTAIVFVADHGEEFREHGSFGHGHSVYEELLHVPLIVRAPGVSARRVSTRVSTIDVPATIVELAGLPAMPNTFSRSLVPLMAGGTRSGPEVAMAEFLDERRVIYAGQYKFFVRGNLTASMFDLGTDPGEQNQLEVSAHPIAARYLRTLQGQFLGASNRSQWLSAEQAGSARLDAGEVQMDGELQQQLRELGYLN
ncbi:MAG: sulfatase [Sandaracinus sp.]|nr:sulfatase [Sandaracinus sp.]MCB9621197.1 sulfatase [Sandaracinus sp.]